MALIKCSECGKEISDTAEKCPKCGVRTLVGQLNYEKEKNHKGMEQVGIFSALLNLIGVILTFSSLITIIKNVDEYSGWIKYGWMDISDIISFETGIGLVFGIILLCTGSYMMWKKTQE